MTRESVEKIIKRYDQAVTVREQYRSIHEAAYEYAIPSRNLYSNQSQGSSNMNKIFDSTGIRATTAFVTNMQKSITPPFKKWVNLKLGPAFDSAKNNEETSGQYKEFNEMLEHATELGFSILNSSNFNSIVPDFYYDLAVGTGVMLTLPTPNSDENPIKFIVVPIEQVAIEKGSAGTVGAVFRTNKMCVRLVKETWPDAKLSSEMQSMLQDDPSKEVCFIEGSYTVGKTTYYDVIDKATKTRIVEREYPFNPWIVTRINKNPIDVFGSGPLIQATPDLRTLNKAKEYTMRNAQLSLFGVYTVADNDVVNPNTITLNPGTFIPVSRNGGPNGPSIAPLPVAGNFNAQNFFIQDLQASVKEMLFDDKLPPDTGPVRSATEIIERIANIRKTTGVFFGPINQEFVQHLWQNILIILVQKQLIALPPELMKVDNFFVQVEILSPIAKEQEIEDVQNLVEAWQIYSSMVGPEQANITFKMDEIGEWIGDKLGAPTTLVRSKEEREELISQMQAAQAAQQIEEEGLVEDQGQQL